MPILSSTIDWDNIQADGRRVVRVTFMDDANNSYIEDFMLDALDDINAVVQSKTDDLNAELSP